MKKVGSFIFILALFSQTSCLFQSKKNRIDGLWLFTHSSGPIPDEYTGANPASFLYLHPERTYTRDFGKFEYGQWQQNDSALLLTNDQKTTISFPVKQVFGSDLMLRNAGGSILNFEKQSAKFSSPAGNPFSVENNKWRIPASKKESDDELRARLRSHFRFHEVYFTWALDAKLSSVDVRSTPSPIKIYGNGFSLKNFDELPESWRSYFFVDEDCQRAKDIIKNIFEKENIAWAQTDNKFKMFISAFQQLQQKIGR